MNYARRLHQLVSVVVLAVACAAASATEERPLFRLGGLDYGEADLAPDLRQRVYEAYAEYRASLTGALADAIASVLGVTADIGFADRRAGDIERSVLDPGAAASLGPATSLEEGLRATADWFRARAGG